MASLAEGIELLGPEFENYIPTECDTKNDTLETIACDISKKLQTPLGPTHRVFFFYLTEKAMEACAIKPKDGFYIAKRELLSTETGRYVYDRLSTLELNPPVNQSLRACDELRNLP
jgi:hypothetical protein